MLELIANFVTAGPLGMYTLYETWSPLFEIPGHWREGRYADAIILTILAVGLVLVVFVMVAVGLRKLRNRYGGWRLRSGRYYSYEMVNMSDIV